MRQFLIALVLAILASTPATATVFSFSYTGSGVEAHGWIYSADRTVSVDGQSYQPITKISGWRNGLPIAGLVARDTPVFEGKIFSIDNMVSMNLTRPFTEGGLGFWVRGSSELYNIYSRTDLLTFDFQQQPGHRYFSKAAVTFDISQMSAVPEPETWASLVAGFAIIGLMLRRRKVKAPALMAANRRCGIEADYRFCPVDSGPRHDGSALELGARAPICCGAAPSAPSIRGCSCPP